MSSLPQRWGNAVDVSPTLHLRLQPNAHHTRHLGVTRLSFIKEASTSLVLQCPWTDGSCERGPHINLCCSDFIPKIQATRNSNPAFSQCCASFGNVGSTAVRYLLMLDGLSRLHRHRVNLEVRKVSHPSRARIFMQCITLPVSVTFSLPSTADLLTHNVLTFQPSVFYWVAIFLFLPTFHFLS